MKAKYEETIEVIPSLSGTLLCKLSWRDLSFQEALPRGIETWSEDEFKAHLRRFVIPKLRVQLLKAQRAALDEIKETEPLPPDIMATLEFSERDKIKLAAAQEKRERKAGKLKIVN